MPSNLLDAHVLLTSHHVVDVQVVLPSHPITEHKRQLELLKRLSQRPPIKSIRKLKIETTKERPKTLSKRSNLRLMLLKLRKKPRMMPSQ